MILVTTEAVAGARVAATIGIVYACIPYFGTKYAEGIGDLRGGTAPDIPAVLERRRAELLARLVVRAAGVGADAVLAVRMDTREITPIWRELCAYGTAVRLAKT